MVKSKSRRRVPLPTPLIDALESQVHDRDSGRVPCAVVDGIYERFCCKFHIISLSFPESVVYAPDDACPEVITSCRQVLTHRIMANFILSAHPALSAKSLKSTRRLDTSP